TLHWVAGFDFPELDLDYEMVCLKHPEEYPLNEGNVASSGGLNIPVEKYEEHFQERQVPHSTALPTLLMPEANPYLVGPLARVNLCFDPLSPTARREAEKCKFERPCRNNFKSIVARALELIHAFEEAIAIVEAYQTEPSPSRVPFELQA